MGRLIDADKLSADMYHEAFEKDSDMQKWDSGCWIRYKMFENVLKAQPEIIRCKDCKHSRFFDPCFYCYEMGGEIIVPENGFCFKAERRQDATD